MKHVGSTAGPRLCVLVTGFGAFPGARTNPTVAILHALERSRLRLQHLGIDLRCAVIPVVYAEIAGTLSHLATRHRPDAVLHLGLAGRRTAVSVETRAVNRAHPLHPDAAGRRPAGQALAAGGPACLPATYPALAILAAIRRRGVKAALSIDAGDYVCNATLYRSLIGTIAPQVGFLHVPRPRNPSGCASRRAGPAMQDLTRAALAAVLVMSARARAVRAATGAPTAPRTDGGPAGR